MSSTPIGAMLGALHGMPRPEPAAAEGTESSDFGMALGLALTPVAAPAPPLAALAAAAATSSGEALPDPTTNSGPPPSADPATAVATGPRAALLRALALETARPAALLARADGAVAGGTAASLAGGAIPLDAALADAALEPLATVRAPARPLAATLPAPTSPDVGATVADAGVTPSPPEPRRAAAALPEPVDVRLRAATRLWHGITTATTATPADTAARADAPTTAAAPARDATPAIPPVAAAIGTQATGGDRPRAETTDKPVPAEAAAPIEGTMSDVAIAAPAPAGRAPADPAPARFGDVMPRDLATVLDAASAVPRRALDQVTLPFESANGLEGRLRIALRGDALHATIVAPDADSAARIEGSLHELHRALVERGFGEVRVAVQHAPAGADADRARSDAREGREDAATQRRARDDERAASHQNPRRQRQGRGQEG